MATAIRGGIIAAKMQLIPVRRGYWGNKLGLRKGTNGVSTNGVTASVMGVPFSPICQIITFAAAPVVLTPFVRSQGLPHTVPMKVAGKSGSVRVRLVPAPRGAAVVGSPVAKKMMAFAGVAREFLEPLF